MNDERQLSRLLRDGMAAETRQLVAGPDFTERVIGRALTAGGGEPEWPRQRPPGWQNWILPAAAAVLVALLLGSVLVGTKLLHSAGSQGPASSPTASQPTPSSSPSGRSSAPSTSSSASSSHSSAPTRAGVGPAGGPVPPGFNGYDLTWVSNDNGWVLGTAPCGSPPCTSILRTTDGGKSWVGIPAPRAELTETDTNTCGDSCGQISNLRFANRLVGYAYGPNALFMTTDGGTTWRRQSGFAYGLEVVDGSVLRVSAQAAGCEPGCTFRLQRASIGSDSWQDVSLPAGGRSASVQLAASGRTVVLATRANVAGGAEDATAVLFTSRDGGSSWHTVGEPCPRAGINEVDSWNVTVAPDGSITVVCAPRAPFQKGTAFTMTSTDGVHFAAGTPVPAQKPPAAVGAVSATGLFVLADLDGLYRSTDAGAHWTKLSAPPGGNYLGFESATVGRIIGAAQSGTAPDGTWTTTDGGQSWTFHSFG